MRKDCKNCRERKTCENYLELLRCQESGNNFFGIPQNERDACFHIDPKIEAKNKRTNQNRKDRNEAMKSLGLVKVRGSVSGQTYWE